MDEQSLAKIADQEAMAKLSHVEQAQLLIAKLMRGGDEDESVCQTLDALSRLLDEDYKAKQQKKEQQSICDIIDDDCVDSIFGYLDMRQADKVRMHASLTTSAYLKAAGDKGSKALSHFFFDRVKRGTYDDYIVAFCVAAAVFPVAPDMMADIFLSEGFLSSLGPLMRRKWKSRKVETACLQMLNAASMNAHCREAIVKYCTEWLEEIVDQDPADAVQQAHAVEAMTDGPSGSIAMRRHSEAVQNLAAVILAKLRVGTLKLPLALPPAFEHLEWR